MDSKIQFSPAPQSDGDYTATFDENYKEKIVRHLFETKHEIRILRVNSKMKSAIDQRSNRINAKNPITDLGNKEGFIISINTNKEDLLNLKNSTIWRLFYNDASIKNNGFIREINNKRLITQYFPKTNYWSKEFLIGVSLPLTDQSNFSLSSGNTRITFSW